MYVLRYPRLMYERSLVSTVNVKIVVRYPQLMYLSRLVSMGNVCMLFDIHGKCILSTDKINTF